MGAVAGGVCGPGTGPVGVPDGLKFVNLKGFIDTLAAMWTTYIIVINLMYIV